MKAGPDTNLESGIFVRNDSGTATINIEGNTVKDNTALRLNADGTTNTVAQNSSDGIEVNACRGSSFATADRFTDGLYGTCAGTATITATIKNNTVSNLLGGADGLDMNVGTGGTLNLTASGNTVTGVGDEALTYDMREMQSQTLRSILTFSRQPIRSGAQEQLSAILGKLWSTRGWHRRQRRNLMVDEF